MSTVISAEIVADSINGFGNRLTTMTVTMPRMILAEFNTHRVLSRNSASSRAIPAKKMMRAVKTDPFIPLIWQKTHKGMQGSVLLDESDTYHAVQTWLVARDKAVEQAEHLMERYDVSKQITNRLLEPFMWHKVLVTATEWENFFALRAESSAEPHMQITAEAMLNAMNDSTPKFLKAGEWHIPFVDDNMDTASRLKISTARAAQTSYTVVGEDGKEFDYVKLVSLHDDLSVKGHWSPFEHQAQCMNDNHWYGNFRSWMPYRKSFTTENRRDSRLKHHDPYSLTT